LGIGHALSGVDGGINSTSFSCTIAGALGGANIIEEKSIRVSPSMFI
jgi:hypothetical protein